MARFIEKPAPLYVIVRKAIIDAINEGEIAQDDRLPSEDSLAHLFSVSRPTVRSALQLLEKEGIISKRHGSESLVNRSCLNLNVRIDDAIAYVDMIAACGQKPSVLSHSFEKVTFRHGVAKRLQLSDGAVGYEMSKIIAGDGNPLISTREYIPEEAFRKLPDAGDFPMDIFKLSDEFLIQPISYTITTISSFSHQEEISKLMDLKEIDNFIKLTEQHFGPDNKPVAYSENVIRDRLLKLQFVRRRF